MDQRCECGQIVTSNDIFCLNCGRQVVKTSEEYTKSENKTFEKYTKNSLCPRCQHTLEEGFISAGNPMHWKTKDSSFLRLGERITDEASRTHFLSRNKLYGFKCLNCKLIIVESD